MNSAELPPAAVVFCPWRDEGATRETFQQVASTTAPSVPLLVPDDARSEGLRRGLPAAVQRRVELSKGAGSDLGSLLARATTDFPGRDLAIVADSAVMSDGWLEMVIAAARHDDTVALATIGWSETPSGRLPFDIAMADLPPEDGAGPAHAPRVIVPHPAGVLIRSEAVGLLPDVDPSLGHPATVLTHIAACLREAGQSCVLAPAAARPAQIDVLADCPRAELEHLARLHPWLAAARSWEKALDPGPLRQSFVVAAAQRQLSVTIDARSLGTGVGGTATYVAGLIVALASSGAVRVRALLARPPDVELEAMLGQSGVEISTHADVVSGDFSLSDVAHRPQQVFTPDDVRLMRVLGDRLVVTHMDLIGYETPTYHESTERWDAYRRTTRAAFAAADQVVFFSDHARRDALSELLVDDDRAVVVGMGIDGGVGSEAGPPTRPPLVPEGVQFLLMLGADYLHKNRPFAIRLFQELRNRHGFAGKLVFAGPHMAHGSSAHLEMALLDRHPELREHVIDAGEASESEKRWLLEQAVAHLAPSLYEGFGLAPLEAARVGRPCIYAAWTAMAETIDPRAAVIVPWDAASSADAAVGLLRSGPARDEHVALLRQAASMHTWDAAIPRLVAAYEAAVSSPYRGSAPQAFAELERESLIATLDQHGRAMSARAKELDAHANAVDKRYRDVSTRFADLDARVAFGRMLIDTHDGLLSINQQRGLMRVARRRWLRSPVFAALGAVGFESRRRRSGDGQADVARDDEDAGHKSRWAG